MPQSGSTIQPQIFYTELTQEGEDMKINKEKALDVLAWATIVVVLAILVWMTFAYKEILWMLGALVLAALFMWSLVRVIGI